jgi:two-component system, OmpR family, heavy metal sensor histidine kinase CusS
MSWKTGNRALNDLPATFAGRWSIASRLALWYLLAVLGSYTVFGALYYAKRMTQLEQASTSDLAAERASTLAMMSEPDGRVLIGYEIRTQQFEPANLRPFLRVLDRGGRTLLESPWLGGAIPREAFPAPGAAPVRWRNVCGDRFLLETSRLPDYLFSGPGGLLQLGVNTREERTLGSQLRLNLLAFISFGLLFAFSCAYFIIRLALKPLAEISCTARNITRHRLDTRIDKEELPAELVSLADSFNSMLERLEDSFTRLSHYSANLAHELRTPINTLMLESDIALSKERTPQEYRRVISSSLEEYGKLSWTIDRLLFLARADHEARDLVRQRLELHAEIEEIFDFFSDAASASGVTLEVRGDAVLLADQTLFRRAISNLVGNALAHTPAGGTVGVTIEQTPELGIRVAVTDTGCGIDQAHLPRIFDRFYRVEPAGGLKREGSGLGLAIVRAILKMHGGTVEIGSRPGKGTTVTLGFPAPAPPG